MFLSEYVPITDNLLDWGAFCGIAALLIAIGIFLPKGRLAVLIERLVLIAAVAAVVVVPFFMKDSGVKEVLLENNFATYILIALAVILLYGLFFNNAYITQGLYGIVIGVALPLGLLGVILPAWTDVLIFSDLFSSMSDVFTLVVYGLLLLISVWLIKSRCYKVRLASAWQVFAGLGVFGSALLFAVQAGYVKSDFCNRMMSILTSNGINMDNLIWCGVFAGVAIVLILIISIVSTVCRRTAYHMQDPIKASETGTAFMIRLLGRIVAVLVSLAALIMLPYLLNANTADTLLKMPKAAICLAPILLMAVILFFVEFLAEKNEIEAAQGKLTANDTVDADTSVTEEM